LLEKIPFFLLSAGSSLITYSAQAGGGAVKGRGPIPENAANAMVSYVKYLWKMLWPTRLSIYYPYHPGAVSILQGALALAALAFLSWLVVWAGRRRPYLLLGWFWYLITLVPVIGFVKLGDHALADRYTYVPIIGLFVIGIWGISDLAEHFRIDRRAVAAAGLSIVGICTVLTNLYAGKWHNSETLFRHALAVTQDNWVAHKNLGAVLAHQGRLDEALFHYSESLRIWPEPLAYVSQGSLYLELGQFGRAVEAARRSIAMLPENNDKAHFIYGASSALSGDYRSASHALEVLKRRNPRMAHQLEGLIKQDLDLKTTHGQSEIKK